MKEQPPLHRVGEALYGETSWKSPLARDLGVNVRTMTRWAKDGPPPTVWKNLLVLARERNRDLVFLLREMEAAKVSP
jgi:hypothetical protein